MLSTLLYIDIVRFLIVLIFFYFESLEKTKLSVAVTDLIVCTYRIFDSKIKLPKAY